MWCIMECVCLSSVCIIYLQRQSLKPLWVLYLLKEYPSLEFQLSYNSSQLKKAKGLLNISDTKSVLKGRDGAVRGIIEECVDLVNVKTRLKLSNGLANGLDGTRLRALVNKVKEVLGEGDTKGILELWHAKVSMFSEFVVSPAVHTLVRDPPKSSSSLASSAVTPRPSSIPAISPPISVTRDRCSTSG